MTMEAFLFCNLHGLNLSEIFVIGGIIFHANLIDWGLSIPAIVANIFFSRFSVSSSH